MPGPYTPDSDDSIISNFRDLTSNASFVQQQTLQKILQLNSHTEYLQNCGLDGFHDLSSFSSRVPLVTHSDLKPYFQRIADGDTSPILTAAPAHTLCLSSGTTSDGEQKYLLLYKEILDASLQLAKISSAFRNKVFPTKPGGRILELVFCGKMFNSKGGLACGTATTHLFRSKEFKMKRKCARLRACSPDAVMYASDNRQAMYCHLLCALLFWEEVEVVNSTFAYTLVEAFRTFALEWQNLCQDIRQGRLSDRITDPEVRNAVSKHLRPDPELADKISQKCSGLERWYGVIPEIWPNCKYILSIITGSMEPYVKRLQHYAGKLPLVGGDYGASECWIGANVDPKSDPSKVSFTVVPDFAYFEFIRVGGEVDNMNGYKEPEPVGLTQVKVGHEYEIVITTFGGLYRYRLGDIVRVTGFFNSSPQLAFVCRKNVLLTINIDKNTEKDLQIVVDKASKLLEDSDVELLDFTSYADLSSTPGHYVVFWELSNDKSVKEETLQKCASTIDISFVEPGYMGSRKVHTIGQLELCIVKPGTFRFLLDRYLSKRPVAAITQYKTPRCIPTEELYKVLRDRVSRTVFSSAYQ